MGTSNLIVDFNCAQSGREVFDRLDEALAKVGLFREPLEEGSSSQGTFVFRHDRSSDTIGWPPDSSTVRPGDVVSTSYSLDGRGPQALIPAGVDVGIEFLDDLAIQRVTVDIPVDAFFTSYDERECDMVLRIKRFLEEISISIGVASAECYWEGEDPWFRYQNRSWNPSPELRRETSGSHALSYLRTLVSENREHLWFDGDSADLFVVLNRREPFDLALLRNNLVNGTLLDPSPRDREFNQVDDDVERQYLEPCWPMRRGIRDVLDRFGPPDYSLGPVSVSTEAWEQEFLIDVAEQVGYVDLDDRFVVFFREYANGRVAVTLAGKRKTR